MNAFFVLLFLGILLLLFGWRTSIKITHISSSEESFDYFICCGGDQLIDQEFTPWLPKVYYIFGIVSILFGLLTLVIF